MKKEMTFSWSVPFPPEQERKDPEEITLYGKGAGLYSYLNVLAETLSSPGPEAGPFEIYQ